MQCLLLVVRLITERSFLALVSCTLAYTVCTHVTVVETGVSLPRGQRFLLQQPCIRSCCTVRAAMQRIGWSLRACMADPGVQFNGTHCHWQAVLRSIAHWWGKSAAVLLAAAAELQLIVLVAVERGQSTKSLLCCAALSSHRFCQVHF